MRQTPSTLESGETLGNGAETASKPIPGLIVIFSGEQPHCLVLRMPKREIEVGRESVPPVTLLDQKISRRHAKVRFIKDRFEVMDLGSRNGTSIDGEPAAPHSYREVQRVVRMGDTLFLVAADIRPFELFAVKLCDERVMGPTLEQRFQAIARAARASSNLHIAGESGVGKEMAARAFHDAGANHGGPFIAVNCAAIPEGLAERLLFGARRGAFSGAVTDSEGYIQAANGGTLFLDEIGELDPQVQGKLLRVLECKEVLVLGAAHPKAVDLRICSATCRDLRGLTASGRLREDLYYRIGRPEVIIPTLYQRPEEIPWLAAQEIRRTFAKASPHASLIEACLLRRWPGNIRELLTELRVAVEEVRARQSTRVEARHLSAGAGLLLATQLPLAVPNQEVPLQPPASNGPRHSLTKTALIAILRRERGNVASASRILGVHRNQMRRWLTQYKIDPREFRASLPRRASR